MLPVMAHRTRSTHHDSATVRRIAVLASVDPRTVIRVMEGETVRGMPGHRIREAMEREGLAMTSTNTIEAQA